MGFRNKKLVVVIDNTLKMPKGKLAREVMGMGIRTVGMLSTSQLIEWKLNSEKAVVVKTDNIQELMKKLNENKIEYRIFVDAGRTVFNGKETLTCVGFFCKDNEFDFVEELKLV